MASCRRGGSCRRPGHAEGEGMEKEVLNIISALDLIRDELSMMDNDEFEDNQYSICNQLQGIIDDLYAIRKVVHADE